MKVASLTTVDNPWNPFTNFNDWFRFDAIEKQYNSCALLSRIARVSNQFSRKEYLEEIERACKEIIDCDPTNMYRIVYDEEEEENSNDL